MPVRLESLGKVLSAIGLLFRGTVTAQEAGSETTDFYINALKDFGNDYFNTRYYCQILKASGVVPEGETRLITDYVSVSGHFTTAAFSANVDVGDEVIIFHKVLMILVPCADTSDPVDMTPEVADHSPLANLLTDDGDVSAYDRRTDSLEAIRDRIDALAATGVGVLKVLEVSVTSAANAGADTVLATVTDQPCEIEFIVIHADAAQTVNMTSAAVKGGTGKVVTFIAAADLLQADVDAADKQVYYEGKVRLAATKTIVMEHIGTGAAALDLTVTIGYRACVAGGYLL